MNLREAIDFADMQLITNSQVRKAGMWQGIEKFKDMDMDVIRNFSFTAKIPTYINDVTIETNADQPWSELHFQERIGGQPLNPGESYKIWPYNSFLKTQDPYMDGEVFSHTYMERFWPKYAGDTADNPREWAEQGIRYPLGDLNDVIKQLKDNPLTRQAYLPIFFPEDTGAKNDIRVPCTIGYLFEVWQGELDITYYIRSCDIFRHFRNDVYLAARLAQMVGAHLGVSAGNLTMHIANLHLFHNDRYAYNKKLNKLRNEDQ